MIGWGNTIEGGKTQERVGKHKRGWGNTREGGVAQERVGKHMNNENLIVQDYLL